MYKILVGLAVLLTAFMLFASPGLRTPDASLESSQLSRLVPVSGNAFFEEGNEPACQTPGAACTITGIGTKQCTNTGSGECSCKCGQWTTGVYTWKCFKCDNGCNVNTGACITRASPSPQNCKK